MTDVADIVYWEAFAISRDRTEIGKSLPAQSITVYSSHMLADADLEIIAEDGREKVKQKRNDP